MQQTFFFSKGDSRFGKTGDDDACVPFACRLRHAWVPLGDPTPIPGWLRGRPVCSVRHLLGLYPSARPSPSWSTRILKRLYNSTPGLTCFGFPISAIFGTFGILGNHIPPLPSYYPSQIGVAFRAFIAGHLRLAWGWCMRRLIGVGQRVSAFVFLRVLRGLWLKPFGVGLAGS